MPVTAFGCQMKKAGASFNCAASSNVGQSSPGALAGRSSFRQRTALCRALMNKPGILLADEPTGSLDERTSRQIFDLLLELVGSEGITLVMATHDRDLAHRCERLMEMRDGKICA